MKEHSDEEARMPEDDYGPAIKKTYAFSIDILPLFKWIKRKLKKEIPKYDNHR